jgi:hypothetical protein
MMIGIRLPGMPPLLLDSARNVIGVCASVGRATKNMYVETAIKAKRARDVVRCIFGLRGLPTASSKDEMAGRVMYDIGEREAKVFGKEDRPLVRRCAIVLKERIIRLRYTEQRTRLGVKRQNKEQEDRTRANKRRHTI